MIIYYLLFIIIIIIQLIPVKRDSNNKIKLVVSFFLFFIYASIRVDYGRDYNAYNEIFQGIKLYGINFDNRVEIGYALLNVIIPNFRTLIVILSAFTSITLYFLFKNYIPSKYYWLTFLFMSMSSGMTFFQLSGLRNAISINILILSLIFIKNRKFIAFFLSTMLAATFHLSSIVYMFFIYFIATPKNITKKDIFLWVIIFISILLLPISFYSSLIGNFEIIMNQYSLYIDKLMESSNNRSFILIGFVTLMFYLTLFILHKYKSTLDKNNIIILKISLIFFISIFAGPISFRATIWYIPFFVAAIPNILIIVKNKFIKYTYLIVSLLYFIYSFFYVYLQMDDFPYKNYSTIFGLTF